jgi:hypothetical protein
MTLFDPYMTCVGGARKAPRDDANQPEYADSLALVLLFHIARLLIFSCACQCANSRLLIAFIFFDGFGQPCDDRFFFTGAFLLPVPHQSYLQFVYCVLVKITLSQFFLPVGGFGCNQFALLAQG